MHHLLPSRVNVIIIFIYLFKCHVKLQTSGFFGPRVRGEHVIVSSVERGVISQQQRGGRSLGQGEEVPRPQPHCLQRPRTLEILVQHQLCRLKSSSNSILKK